MTALLVVALVLSLSPGRQDQAALQQEIYQALQAGTPAAEMELRCRRACRLFPRQAYFRLALADTLFRLRRLQAAVNSYDRVLELAAPGKSLAKRARQNRDLAGEQLAEIRRGRALARRALVAGWIMLGLLVGGVLWLAWKY